jgi:subtilisin
MAAPVVAGYAARLLGAQTQILNMPRDSARADALLQLLFAAALSLGFTALFEGRGGPK